ncbi:hypothetical protein A2U01_0024403, partial [Trifolium medium]|nr:hypothetical protein [Trifolium medium]
LAVSRLEASRHFSPSLAVSPETFCFRSLPLAQRRPSLLVAWSPKTSCLSSPSLAGCRLASV